MACIKKQDLGKPLALAVEQFPLPALGEGSYVNIRALGSRDLAALQKTDSEEKSNIDAIYEILAKCLVDDEGAFLFDSAEDMKENFNQPLSLIEEMGEVAIRVSGLSKKN